MQIKIKDGTPKHGDSLCRTCRWAHLVKGYRESEEVIICSYVDPNCAVAFSVRDCNHYRSSITPTPQQMEEIALIIAVEPTRKPAGFVVAVTQSDVANADELVSAKS